MLNMFHLTVDDENVGFLEMDMPDESVNKLTTETMLELEMALDDIAGRDDIIALIIRSRKPNIFIAGADIDEIRDLTEESQAMAKATKGQDILNKIAELGIPTIAEIDGACLGGGLELALACEYRVASNDNEKTSLGLPEVQLGIMPGFGGTQRLPRLLGLKRALPLILSAKPVDAKKALRIHLVDALFPQSQISEMTLEFTHKILDRGDAHILERRHQRSMSSYLTEDNLLMRALIFEFAQSDVMKKTKGHYRAPLAALELIQDTYEDDLLVGLKKEAEAFSKLAVTEQCKNLVSLFYINDDLKKDSGVDVDVEPRDVDSSAVVGAGIMGGGIAWLLSNRDIPVRIKDISWDAVAKAFQTTSDIYKVIKKIKRWDDRDVQMKINHLSSSLDYSGFGDVDIIIEAVVENIDIKKSVFKELEGAVRDDAIIASNTSTLPISDMASVLDRPERFIGMHFFNPVNRMPLVEVIPGEKTSPEVVATVVALCKKLKKTAIVVQDRPGFLVNRLLMPYLNEAACLVEDGVSIERIDRVFVDFGMPMGPLHLLDEVGFDVAIKAGGTLSDAFPDRMQVNRILERLYGEMKLLGKKGDGGFYSYDGDKKELNSAVALIFQGQNGDNESVTDDEILERCLYLMINEAVRCLDEGVVKSQEHLDMAMIMGTGFPPFRGGLLRYAEQRGYGYIRDRLQEFSERYGERFKPCDPLIERAGERHEAASLNVPRQLKLE